MPRKKTGGRQSSRAEATPVEVIKARMLLQYEKVKDSDKQAAFELLRKQYAPKCSVPTLFDTSGFFEGGVLQMRKLNDYNLWTGKARPRVNQHRRCPQPIKDGDVTKQCPNFFIEGDAYCHARDDTSGAPLHPIDPWRIPSLDCVIRLTEADIYGIESRNPETRLGLLIHISRELCDTQADFAPIYQADVWWEMVVQNTLQFVPTDVPDYPGPITTGASWRVSNVACSAVMIAILAQHQSSNRPISESATPVKQWLADVTAMTTAKTESLPPICEAVKTRDLCSRLIELYRVVMGLFRDGHTVVHTKIQDTRAYQQIFWGKAWLLEHFNLDPAKLEADKELLKLENNHYWACYDRGEVLPSEDFSEILPKKPFEGAEAQLLAPPSPLIVFRLPKNRAEAARGITYTLQKRNWLLYFYAIAQRSSQKTQKDKRQFIFSPGAAADEYDFEPLCSENMSNFLGAQREIEEEREVAELVDADSLAAKRGRLESPAGTAPTPSRVQATATAARAAKNTPPSKTVVQGAKSPASPLNTKLAAAGRKSLQNKGAK